MNEQDRARVQQPVSPFGSGGSDQFGVDGSDRLYGGGDLAEFGWNADVWIRAATMLASCSSRWSHARDRLRGLRAAGGDSDDKPYPDANARPTADSY